MTHAQEINFFLDIEERTAVYFVTGKFFQKDRNEPLRLAHTKIFEEPKKEDEENDA